MKIALITIHNANNYGAVLQAYATKKILSQYGEVETINYDNKHLSSHLDILRFSFSIRGTKMLVHDLLRLPYRINVIGKFKKFIYSNMNLTKKLTSDELLQGKAGTYDVYVCGSDQIWNPNIVNRNGNIDPIYFLSFAIENAKKISYASSIGNYIFTNKEKNYIQLLLQEFSEISIREKDGKEKLLEILPKKNIFHVVDPTLLLSKKEWNKLFSLDKNINSDEKYILVYSVPKTKLLKNTVEYFSKKMKLKVISIDQMLTSSIEVDKHIRNASPEEYLKLFFNAEFIITDSFHGTCFSINFNKQFISVSSGKVVNRIESFLNLLDLNKRLISNKNEFEGIYQNINYNIVNDKLKKLKKESIHFLEQAINNS